MSSEGKAPAWLDELRLAYESGAHGQFVLYGNVADRFPLDGRLVSLTRYLEARLLGTFDLVFLYDPGNGLSLLRGGERFAQWPAAEKIQPWPHEPRAAIELISRYLRYRANLQALGRGDSEHVAVILRGAELVLPASRQGDFASASLASLVRDWAAEPPFADMAFASLLLADNLNDLHPLVANNPRIDRVQVPLPDADSLGQCLAQLRLDHPKAFAAEDNGAVQALAGVSLSALASLVKRRAHQGKVLGAQDWVEAKKQLVETDSAGLVEFIESKRTLDDYHAQDALKVWLRQDMALWQAADLRALPKGYIFCGPVGTGKTYLVECLAGEAGVPVVKLKNFRDRWVGSSEGNLEKIFRLIRGLGRCIVFIDEADQTLGKRDGGSGDSGLSGRLYSMIAQEMGDADNRGKVIWILASSRPDLIEVDLKRPGRVDVKIPLLPTTTIEESAALLRALLKRFELKLESKALVKLPLPLLLTPGAAEALAVKVYRQVRTAQMQPLAALEHCLQGYQPPVAEQVLRLQMSIAIREATDMAFVPESLRHLADENLSP
ncbi:AAA family ATPase [Pseudomonas borbori]|uniref:ATPase family associated with various cellular activities (AAA) n=1 Tax=Pseudomonas borbori TaxID=289003 RepID=A0A1I5R2M2_9PSED|nr:ATP-binding protein [Pseudomonas borbori]SFP52752.1 ATPase family associated with various cellular activities (AAA) [Pseudomonas borbori]